MMWMSVESVHCLLEVVETELEFVFETDDEYFSFLIIQFKEIL